MGVRFVPCNDHTAEMKISVNGRDLRYCTAETLYDGPLSGEIPYQDGPIYAVFDVYGTTKAIGVVQISYCKFFFVCFSCRMKNHVIVMRAVSF